MLHAYSSNLDLMTINSPRCLPPLGFDSQMLSSQAIQFKTDQAAASRYR